MTTVAQHSQELESLSRCASTPAATSNCSLSSTPSRQKLPGEPRECFIAFNCTLLDLNMVLQDFKVHCFLNCLFLCPELDDEKKAEMYLAPVAEWSDTQGQQHLGHLRTLESHSRETPGAVRYYKTGFKMNPESTFLPFNPDRIFDTARVKEYTKKDEKYYFYPVTENTGTQCGGLVKMVVEFEVKLSEAFFMHHYPFDRQIMEMGVKLRPGWTNVERAEWNDTGYNADKNPAICTMSESILSYSLYPPWLNTKGKKDWNTGMPMEASIFLRIEREYDYELNKVFLPLFLIVCMSTAAFGLEPKETADRMNCALTMMLACIGFQYVLSTFLPKQPHSTFLDKYQLRRI